MLHYYGWIHLQHTRISIAFARLNFLLFLSFKKKKFSEQMRRVYRRMLQMNPPYVMYLIEKLSANRMRLHVQ